MAQQEGAELSAALRGMLVSGESPVPAFQGLVPFILPAAAGACVWGLRGTL